MKIFKSKYWCPLLLLGCMLLVSLIEAPVFYLNDDVTMRSILSGAYTGTPDGHAVYMQYPLTGLLAMLYFVLPMLPWLEVFFAGCIWVCMIFLANSFSKRWVGILCAAVLYLPFFWYMHYTIVAALVAGTAVLLLCKDKKNWWAVSLWSISYMIRSQVGLLALPFVGAAYVWQLVTHKENWKAQLIQSLKYIGSLLAAMLLITGVNTICYVGQEWQYFLDYNESRTQLYDYTDFLSTDKYAKEYASYDMSEKDYGLLSSYNTMLESNIDAKKLQQIADKITEGMQQDQSVMSNLKDCGKKYYTQLRYNDFPYNYLWFGAVIILAAAFVWQKKWLQLGFLGILEIGRSSVWMYLLWKGRFPERVSFSLYLIELLLLLGIGLTGLVESTKKIMLKNSIIAKVLTVGFAVILLGMGGYFGSTTIKKVQERNIIQDEWSNLKKYCEENSQNVYLLDVFSSVKYSDRLLEEDCENLMLLGGWMTESPLAKARMISWGGSDAAEVLAKNQNARLIMAADKDTSWINGYLQDRFADMELKYTDDVMFGDSHFSIYELQ